MRTKGVKDYFGMSWVEKGIVREVGDSNKRTMSENEGFGGLVFIEARVEDFFSH